MEAIEFKEQNVVFAKDQDDYENLPAHAQQNGMVTFCMKLTPNEMKKIRATSTLTITVLNFNRPVQPVAIHCAKPEFPVPFDLDVTASPNEWDKEKGLAKFKFHLTKDKVSALKKDKKLWITTVTYGAPLQPISQTLG